MTNEHIPSIAIERPEDRFVIWWLTSNEAMLLVEDPFFIASTPAYIQTEVNSRNGRPGRGRLWVTLEWMNLNIDTSDYWIHGKPLHTVLGEEYGGIIILKTDFDKVTNMGGIFTTLKMERIFKI